MIRTITTAAVIALGLGAGSADALAQYRPPYPPVPPAYPQRGYTVQIRQPNWKTTTVASEYELGNFVEDKRRHGWEVDVRPLGGGTFEVSYRLLRWGGTRYGVAPTMHEA